MAIKIARLIDWESSNVEERTVVCSGDLDNAKSVVPKAIEKCPEKCVGFLHLHLFLMRSTT